MNGKKRCSLGLGVGAVCLVISAVNAQTSGTLGVSSYPPEVQKQYKLFAEKCSRCHDLSRPLSAKYNTEAQWREMVTRMARKPGAGISPKAQVDITSFLVYRQKAQSGSAQPAPGSRAPDSGSPSTPAPTATSPPAGAGDVNLTPPVAHTAQSTERTGEATESGGLRVEVDALPAQPILALADGHWSREAPGAGENLFLAVRVFDAATGEKVPYAMVTARVGGDNAGPEKPLRPLFGANGFQYGGNISAPAGDLEVSLTVEPPSIGHVNENGPRWSSPLNLKLTLHRRS